MVAEAQALAAMAEEPGPSCCLAMGSRLTSRSLGVLTLPQPSGSWLNLAVCGSSDHSAWHLSGDHQAATRGPWQERGCWPSFPLHSHISVATTNSSQAPRASLPPPALAGRHEIPNASPAVVTAFPQESG